MLYILAVSHKWNKGDMQKYSEDLILKHLAHIQREELMEAVYTRGQEFWKTS